jgi:hypothetical protein
MTMNTALLLPRQQVEYRLGRNQVPRDVIRPRRQRNLAVLAAGGEDRRCRLESGCPVRANEAEAETGVPEVLEADRERTAPIAMETRLCGPSQAELEQLAAGELGRSLALGGRYRLDGLLGKGGMARVFRGEQEALGRAVAVKILDDERRGDRHAALRRFMSEARITAGLRHPNVVEVSDFGSTPEGLVYLVMELLDGEDLRQTIRREGPLPWARVRAMMLQICSGLALAHQRGVIHRDLKPSNCFRVATAAGEQIKLLDFGIALLTGEAARTARVTRDDNVVGTPEYMSPEQARGDEVDVRSDVYALGVILGELLTGKVPFTSKSATGVIAAHLYESAPSLRALAGRAEVDAQLEAIYAKALRKDPAERFASVEEFAAAIAAIPAERELVPCEVQSQRQRRRRRLWTGVVAAAVAIMGLGAGLMGGAPAEAAPVACERAG